jgi:hypothetical protein
VTASAPRREPLVEVIYRNLKQVLRGGIRPAKLLHCPELLELAVASTPVPEDADPYSAAIALENILRTALARLGAGPEGRAAQLLFGAVPETRGRLLKDRRRLAAQELDVLPSTFRRNYENDILRDLAMEVFASVGRLTSTEHKTPPDGRERG